MQSFRAISISGLMLNGKVCSQTRALLCTQNWLYNWLNMILVQWNLEVIARSDNRGLAVRGREPGPGLGLGGQDVGNIAMHFRSLALDCTVRWSLAVTVRSFHFSPYLRFPSYLFLWLKLNVKVWAILAHSHYNQQLKKAWSLFYMHGMYAVGFLRFNARLFKSNTISSSKARIQSCLKRHFFFSPLLT